MKYFLQNPLREINFYFQKSGANAKLARLNQEVFLGSALLNSSLARSPYFGLVPFFGPVASFRHMPTLTEDAEDPADNKGLPEMRPIPQEIENLERALEPPKSPQAKSNTLTIAPGTLERQYRRVRHCLNTLLEQIEESRRISPREQYTYAACGVTGTLLSVALTVSILAKVVFAPIALAILVISTTCLLSLASVTCSAVQLRTLYSNYHLRSRLPKEELDPLSSERLNAIRRSLNELSSSAQQAVASPFSRYQTPNP